MPKVGETTALVIEHTVRKEDRQRYEKWTAAILEAARKSPGYLSREVFPPAAEDKPYVVIVRFQTANDLQLWLDSPERGAFIEEMRETLQNGDKTTIKAGIDVWFTPENAPDKPNAYKQFLLVAAAAYPLPLIIPYLLSPLFAAVPVLQNPLLSGLIITPVMIGLMTYVVVPLLTHWLRNWLYDSKKT